MRHLKARQRDDTGLWHYTSMKNERIAPIGYCSLWTNCKNCTAGYTTNGTMCEPCGGTGAIKKANPCQGHINEQEAIDHYHKYLVDKAVFTDDVTDNGGVAFSKCGAPGCKKKAGGAALVGMHMTVDLCAKHRTPEVLHGLVTVSESWES